MSKQTTHIAPQKPSALDSFGLGFEYDRTWKDVKRITKERAS